MVRWSKVNNGDAVETPDALKTPDTLEIPDVFVTPDALKTPDSLSTPDIFETPDMFETPDALIWSVVVLGAIFKLAGVVSELVVTADGVDVLEVRDVSFCRLVMGEVEEDVKVLVVVVVGEKEECVEGSRGSVVEDGPDSQSPTKGASVTSTSVVEKKGGNVLMDLCIS